MQKIRKNAEKPRNTQKIPLGRHILATLGSPSDAFRALLGALGTLLGALGALLSTLGRLWILQGRSRVDFGVPKKDFGISET